MWHFHLLCATQLGATPHHTALCYSMPPCSAPPSSALPNSMPPTSAPPSSVPPILPTTIATDPTFPHRASHGPVVSSVVVNTMTYNTLYVQPLLFDIDGQDCDKAFLEVSIQFINHLDRWIRMYSVINPLKILTRAWVLRLSNTAYVCSQYMQSVS